MKKNLINEYKGFNINITGDGDLAMDGELKSFILNKTNLILVRLTKDGHALVANANGETYKVPPSNIVLATEGTNKPNGETSWNETYFEVVRFITEQLMKDEPCRVVAEVQDSQGTGGMYELAETLTNEFEQTNKDREWDGDFFDEIEYFLSKKLF